MSRDVLEVDCSRLSDVVRSGTNWSNKLWELLEEKLLDQVFVVEASLRLEIVCCTESMNLRRMRTTRNSHK
ncbi:hypothetical protein A2U01_0068835 [Trifolium medium]|uniref:Uncharacterized protein n=1 Tax=Trifolium medium TaxID=97028 RepID=A0A392SF83_9FABA|nr:hypothetical protein [Trifolium medium]